MDKITSRATGQVDHPAHVRKPEQAGDAELAEHRRLRSGRSIFVRVPRVAERDAVKIVPQVFEQAGRPERADVKIVQEAADRHRKAIHHPGLAHVHQLGIALPVVHMVVMAEVHHAILGRRRDEREHAEQVRSPFVEQTILEQDVVRAFMHEAGEPVLHHADAEDGEHGDRHVPPERESPGGATFEEADAAAKDQRQRGVIGGDVKPVGDVVGRSQRRNAFMQSRRVQRLAEGAGRHHRCRSPFAAKGGHHVPGCLGVSHL